MLFSAYYAASSEASTILVLNRGKYLAVISLIRHNLFLDHRENFA